MAAVTIPRGLDWWLERPDGVAWLERLPRLAAECAEQWSLELEEPFEDSNRSWVAPAGELVLKINFPEDESEREADALVHWDGRGAARLLAHDPERRALLVERCRPGTTLWQLPEGDATPIAADVLQRLWRPPPAEHELDLVADAAPRWADLLARRELDAGLRDLAVGYLYDLAASQGEQVVAHQDFHGGNVLLSQRGWLAIDPRPLVGEREFDTASLLRDRGWQLKTDPGQVRRRLDYLAAELGLDRERMRGWGIAHALWWGWNDDRMLACARLLAEA